MLVTVLGKQVVSYTKKGAEVPTEGISLFYAAEAKRDRPRYSLFQFLSIHFAK